ncbi:OmpH family outer membrane protein [Lacibacterium aquatile]|uniref:OmpH family outer membrane protein n=1 Tax=Lacibacterium aquatile TaxID=1168082 RepID=A0ABW5DJI7_9PROT
MNIRTLTTGVALIAVALSTPAFAQAPTGFTLTPPPAAPGEQSAPAAMPQAQPAPVTPQINPVQIPARPPAAAGARPAVAGAGAANVSIGVVDLGEVLGKSTAVKSLREQMEKQAQAAQAEFKKKEDDLRKEEQALNGQRASLSQEQFNEKGRALQAKFVEFQRQVAARRRQLAEGESQSMQPVQKTIEEILPQVATEKGINLILHRQAVMLNSNDLDLTTTLVTRLNQKMPKATLKLPALKTN